MLFVPPIGWRSRNALTMSFAGSGQSTTNTTNVSVASVGIGTASSDRWVVVVIGDAVQDVISAVTIGGISATIIVQQNTADPFPSMIAIAIAKVPTGTTATVAWTIGSATVGHAVAAYALTGLASSTATATGNDASAPSTASINVSAGGCAIGGMYTNLAGVTHAWSGLTKDVDKTPSGVEFSAASKSFVAAQTPLVVTCTPSTGNSGAFVAASFR